VAPENTEKNWTANWEDTEWDDEDPDDSFQQRLREEIMKAIARNQSPQKAK
jgi:26 proteasome complex subunit DSS1